MEFKPGSAEILKAIVNSFGVFLFWYTSIFEFYVI